jgi:hypothetical protein
MRLTFEPSIITHVCKAHLATHALVAGIDPGVLVIL